ncbi:sorting nexin-9-like [Styela clava]
MAQVGDKVTVLYEFDGIVDNHELALREGDIVTLTNPDVGEGWWEGQASDGTVGLFPSAYCELVQDNGAVGDAEYDESYAPPEPQETTSYNGDNQQQHEEVYDGGDDDEWEASWGVQNYSAQAPTATSQPVPIASSPAREGSTKKSSESDSPKKNAKNTGLFSSLTGNIFSAFSVTPAESFILGDIKADTSSKPKIHMVLTEDGPMWDNTAQQHFTCTISDPQKASKFSGFKSYITYNITPSHSGKTVSRRYKHFDWLLEQLVKKFNVTIAVPPLPDKQLTGRYEDEFIEGRMHQLQGWLSRMSLHPVISQSEVFQHFLVSKDSEKAWKEGKRKAESDPAVGGAFCTTIVPVTENRMELSTAEQTLQYYSQFTRAMDESLKQIVAHGAAYSRKCQGPLMQEYQKMGQCFGALGDSFAMDKRQNAAPLTEAIKHTGKTYEDIGLMYQEQPKQDWNPLLDGLNEYKGIMACFPTILGNNKSAIDKQREMMRLQLEGKYTEDDVENAKLRAETLSYAVQAEINHMQYYRVGDFAAYMKSFVQQQVVFYQNIVSKLQDTARMYDNLQ